MTPRERIMAALLLEESDTVPVSPVFYKALNFLPQDFYETLTRISDGVYRVGVPTNGIFYSDSKKAKVTTRNAVFPDHVIYESILETPKGPLVSKQIATKTLLDPMCIKGYIENEEDVEKFLSIPYEACHPDPKAFLDEVKILGDMGVVMCDFADAICILGELFKLDKFYQWIHRKPDLIRDLLDALHIRIMDYVESLLKSGVGPFQITGPEYVCTTFVAPRFFDSLVVAYDQQLIKLIHEYGQLVIIHCHGKVNALLEKFAEMGTDGLHPLESSSETWSSGDIDLVDAKRRVGHKFCFLGNIQTGDLEMGSKELVEQRCRETIEQAGVDGGLILEYTGIPKSKSIETRFCENLLNMIKAGRKWGKYPQKP